MDVLLVFAKIPAPGAVKTRLAPVLGDAGAAALYAAMLADSLDAYLRLGVAVRLCLAPTRSPMPENVVPNGVDVTWQAGDDLGDRLDRAFGAAFANGARRVVVIGTDHPTLPLSTVRAAFDRLAAPDRLTVAPADDGGFVLLGLARPAPGLFSGRAYSHPAVLAETLATAVAAGLNVERLPAWHDVDEPADLDRLRADLSTDADIAPRTRAVLATLDALVPDARHT